jgi:hypothetical protein
MLDQSFKTIVRKEEFPVYTGNPVTGKLPDRILFGNLQNSVDGIVFSVGTN